jgi:putative ABC transport system permease protein
MGILRWWYQLSMRVRSLVRGGALDRELDEELQFHLDQLVAAHIARGLSPEAARREALLAIGGIEQRKEECRDTRRVRWVGDAMQDLRYALNTLRRSPGFATASILTLGLGIGTTIAMFTIVNGVLLRPMPFPDADRLHLVSLSPRTFFMRDPGMADGTFVAFRERDRTFQHLAAFTNYRANLTGAGEPAAIEVGRVTTEFFDALGVPPAIGRTFLPDDGQEGREPIVVLSDQLWRSRFGADPEIVGKPVRLDGVHRIAVGVMPAGFDFPRRAAAWTPFIIKLDPGNSLLFPVLGRLKPGITLEQARAAFDAMLPALTEGEGAQRFDGWTVGILPLKELLVGDIRRPLQIFSGAVLLVLLIACANVANLLLARASGREREIAVRAALGASRPRLVRQLLTESALLSLLGTAVGVVLARWAVDMLLALAPAGRIPRTEMIQIDGWVIAFAIVAAAVTGILFGLAPALRLSRRRFAGALLPGGRSVMRGHDRFRATLVVSEIALALVLLTGAGLLTKSFLRLRSVDSGFRPDNVVRLSVELPQSTYESPSSLHAFHQDMLARLRALPGIVAAGIVNWLPLGSQHLNGDFQIEGGGQDPGFNVDKTAVSPGYFQAIGIRLLRGREFTDQDHSSSLGVAIVSRMVAAAIDPSEDVVGRRVSIWGGRKGPNWLTIVGVVDDVKQMGPSQKNHPAIYQPYLQVQQRFFLSHMTYVIRTASEPLAAIPAIRSVLRVVDKDQPATAIGLLSDVVDRATAEPGFYARLLGGFALLAVVLALVGTYGVIAYSVAQRTHEIGLRMALGAHERSVLWLVIRRTIILGGIGVLIGTIGAWMATRLLETFLFEITPTDPGTFAAVALIVFTAALLAGLIPGRRAIRIDPLVALRHE